MSVRLPPLESLRYFEVAARHLFKLYACSGGTMCVSECRQPKRHQVRGTARL